jgi:hypothetical protein
MIKAHSDDPNVEEAAAQALEIINDTLSNLPRAETFDYGGHQLKIGEYGVCERCTRPIAEAQAAEQALKERAEKLDNDTIKEHLDLAAKLFHEEAEAAIERAELHNGHGTEQILNKLLAFQYERGIGESYDHSHHPAGGAQ